VRPMVEEFTVRSPEGVLKRILLLAEGRLVNLSAAKDIRRLSWTYRSPTCARGEWLARDRDKLSNRVHAVPGAIDAEIARLKLATMGTSWTSHRVTAGYLASWTAGP